MKKTLLLAAILLSINCFAQRFLEESFSRFDTLKNIKYGQATNLNGQPETLLLDFYAPHKDQLKKRPLVLFVHGGGYTGGDKATGYPITFAEGLLKRGFAVASINYRLGLPQQRTNKAYFEAMYRAAQDSKTALRYLRQSAKKYGIDKAKIIIMGGSAGAHAILHVVYMDAHEVPQYIDQQVLGSWANDTKPLAAINCWGAITDYRFIQKGDPPLFSMHGENDPAVPVYESDTTHGFRYGPRYMEQHMKQLGIYTATKIYPNTGHTLDGNLAKQCEGLNLACQWLYAILTDKKKK
jgi:acetyl esterase/lipase